MKPAVAFNLPDDFPDFHAKKLRRRRFLFQRGENAFENPFAVVAAEDFHGVGVFLRREVVLRDEFGCDGRFGHGVVAVV